MKRPASNGHVSCIHTSIPPSTQLDTHQTHRRAISVTTCIDTSSAGRIFEIRNRIVTSVFDSKRVQLFEIFEFLPSLISYLKKPQQCGAIKTD